MIPFTTDIPAGTLVAAEYRIARKLADGGMGAVFVARQESTGNLRALKIIRGEWGDDPEFRARFQREARLSAQIKSDHVVQIIQAGTDETLGLEFLVMELLAGETLAARVARVGALSGAEVLEIVRQARHGLGAAHGIGVIHRDLKPENVFLADPTREGEPFVVKILDFGIAKVLADSKTASTKPLGTPAWLAPEQTDRRSRVGPETDVWALGLIVFFMLTGKSYWLASNDEESGLSMLMREVLIDPLPAASERAKVVGGAPLPPGFDAWFARAVVRDPKARFSTVAHMVSALETVLHGEGMETFGERPTEFHGEATAPQAPSTPIATPSAPIAMRSAAIVTPSASTAPPATSRPSRLPIVGGVFVVIAAGGAFGVYQLTKSPPTPKGASSAVVSASPSTSARTTVAPTAPVPSARAQDPSWNRWVPIPDTNVEMQQHEVTWRELGAAKDQVRPSGGAGDALDLPATGVTWAEAEAFCASIGARLPSDPEWRKASTPIEAAPPSDVPASAIVAVGTRSSDRVGGFWDLWGNAIEWTSTPAEEPGPKRMVLRGRHRERPDHMGYFFLCDDPAVEPGPRELAVGFGSTGLQLTAEEEDILTSCAPMKLQVTLHRGPSGRPEVTRVDAPLALPGCTAVFQGYRWDTVLIPWDAAEATLPIHARFELPKVSLADAGFRCARTAKP